MKAATGTQRMQSTLQELIDFLGKVQISFRTIHVQSSLKCKHQTNSIIVWALQTYITTCEEVARTEYAVQSNLRTVQDLQAALSQQNNVFADQYDAPSIPASSQIGQMTTSSEHFSLHTPD